MLCVVCWGGDQGSHAPSPMPPAPCPQPHAPNPMPLEESKASPFAWLQTRHQVHSSPKPHASCPQPHASRGEQTAPGLHACEMTLSQCPHAPSPRIQWGWGQLARIQTCAPSPMPPAPGGMGPSPFAWIHPMPNLDGDDAIDAVSLFLCQNSLDNKSLAEFSR